MILLRAVVIAAEEPSRCPHVFIHWEEYDVPGLGHHLYIR